MDGASSAADGSGLQWPTFRRDALNTGLSPLPLCAASHQQRQRDGGGNVVRAVHVGGLVWGTAVAKSARRVYVGSTNRTFHCIDAVTARIVWTYVIPPTRADTLIDSAAAISPDGSLVVVPGGDGQLHALDAETGTVRWIFRARHPSDTDPDSGVVVSSFEGNVRFSDDGSRVYAGSDNSAMYCVSAGDGRELWRHDTGMMIWTVCGLIRGRDAVFCSLDGAAYVVDGLTGRAIASHRTGGEVKSSPLVMPGDGERIVVCNSSGTASLLELDREAGTLRPVWSAEMGAEVYASPALLLVQGAGAAIVVADMNGDVTALSASDGMRLWRVRTHNYTTSSPVTTSDGMVLLGSSCGRLIVIDARGGTGRLAGSPLLSASSTRRSPGALNASPILVRYGDGPSATTAVVIGSYDGNVYIVPGCACLDAAGDGPLLPLAPDGSGRTTHVSRVSPDGAAIVSLRLNAYGVGKEYDPSVAIIEHTLRVRMRARRQQQHGGGTAEEETGKYGDMRDKYDVFLSPDGRFINLVPAVGVVHGGEDGAAASLAVRVWGEYRRSNTWISDRVSDVAFRGTPFDCAVPPAPLCAPLDAPSSYFDRMGAGWWELSGMFCSQPTVLETYVPAAMDAQGFIAHPFGLRSSSGGRGGRGTFFILCIPSLPATAASDAATVVRDPSKVLVLQARYDGDRFSATTAAAGGGAFTISAMGGTITMSDFRVYGRVTDRSTGALSLEFYARASCLSLKGNGSSYQFSPKLVNQMCDRWMNVHVIGGGSGRRVVATAEKQGPGAGRGSAAPALCVAVNPSDGSFRTWVGAAASASAALAYTAAGGELVFVDGMPHPSVRQRTPTAAPRRMLWSADGWMLDNVLNSIVAGACAADVHPNAITLSSFITTAAMVLFHLQGGGARLAVPCLMLYKWLADVLDGAVARSCGRVSKMGGLLDSVADYIFSAACIVLLLTAKTTKSNNKNNLRLIFAAAAAAAAVPWVALTLANGPGAITEHSAFKNGDSWVNAVTWFCAENTVVVIGAIAALYVALAVPNAPSLAVRAVRGALFTAAPGTLVAWALVGLAAVWTVLPTARRHHGGRHAGNGNNNNNNKSNNSNNRVRYRAIAATLLLLPALVVVVSMFRCSYPVPGHSTDNTPFCGTVSAMAAVLLALFVANAAAVSLLPPPIQT